MASEDTYADPGTIRSGAKSPFKIYISDEAVGQEAETYEFILQWQDENGSEESRRVLTEESVGQTTSEQPPQNDTITLRSQGQLQNLTASLINNQTKTQVSANFRT